MWNYPHAISEARTEAHSDKILPIATYNSIRKHVLCVHIPFSTHDRKWARPVHFINTGDAVGCDLRSRAARGSV